MFLVEMSDRMVKDALEKIEKGDVPEAWDGFELRRWMAEKWKREIMRMPREQVREFNNVLAVNNL